jgi:hypothetical protein
MCRHHTGATVMVCVVPAHSSACARAHTHARMGTRAHECTFGFKVFYTCLYFITMNTGDFGRKKHWSLVPTKINDSFVIIPHNKIVSSYLWRDVLS